MAAPSSMHDAEAKLWLIEPVADPADSAWQDRTIYAEVVVVAPSPAFARLAAARRLLSGPWIPIGNESDSRRSGFDDVRLYHVYSLPEARRGSFAAVPHEGEVLLMRKLFPEASHM